MRGFTDEEWLALPEVEQIRLDEDHQDGERARSKHMTLEAYRASFRAWYEAGKSNPDYGQPQWLRDQYAQERPREIVAEYAELLARAATAEGAEFEDVACLIAARVHRGLVFREAMFSNYWPPVTYEGLKEDLLGEIKRVGLVSLFRKAARNHRDRAARARRRVQK